VTDAALEDARVNSLLPHALPAYVRIYRIHGPFLFGATDKLRVIAEAGDSLPEVVILRLRHMTAIDATGLRAIEDLAETLRTAGRELILCGARNQPAALMKRADFHRHVGDRNFCANIREALARAQQLHGQHKPSEPAA
jgi:SulP family sulfate permease